MLELPRPLPLDSIELARHWAAGAALGTWSDELYRLHGLEPGAPVGRTAMLACVHPDDRAALDATIYRRLFQLAPISVDYRVVLPDASVRWLHGRIELLRDHHGRVVVLRGTAQDITDRKLADQAVRTSKERLRAALECGGIGVLEIDAATHKVTWDRSWNELLGRQPEDFPDVEAAIAVLHPDDQGTVRDSLARAFAGEPLHLELRHIKPDDSIQWLAAHARLVHDAAGHPERLVGAFQDITERKRSEHHKARSAALGDILASATSLVDAAPRLARVLASADDCTYTALWHRDARGALGMIGDHPPGDAAADAGIVAEVMATGGPVRRGDRVAVPVAGPAGVAAAIVARTRGAPAMDAAVEAELRDTAARLSSFVARCHAEAQIHRFLSLSPAALYALVFEEDDVRRTWLSDNMTRITGYTTSEAVHHAWWTARVHPDDLPRVLAAHSRPYRVPHQVLEYRFRHRDGHYIWIRDEKRLVFDDRGEPTTEVIGTWSDISERVQLEQQLRQSQKLEALGQLAGGVAHDFNNVLTVIGSATEMLRSMVLPADPRDELLVEIDEATARAAALTRQLLAFSRSQVVAPRVIDAGEIVTHLRAMLRRLIGEDIELVVALAPVARIEMDPCELEQIIINIAVNARDAMPRGGTLRVSLDEAAPAERSGEPYVRLSIADTGSGMTPEVRARIFEPFFTTKGVGKGTGLGLSTVFGIVQRAGGRIDVATAPGEGTRFDVYLPVATATAAAASARRADGDDTAGDETILLVEDDPGVRRSARVALERQGYRVLEAHDGRHAVEIATRHAGMIHLVLTDVVMPNLGGRELATQLRALDPRIRVLYVSGDIDDAPTQNGIASDRDPFLPKPFSPLALAQKVREVLASRADAP